MTPRRMCGLVAAAAVAAAVPGCGDDHQADGTGTRSTTARPEPPGRVEVVSGIGGGRFDPTAIYRREAPGVVTVISEFGAGQLPEELGGGGAKGLGSGFVLNGKGEIATNAHVVSVGAAGRRARAVYVQFGDLNQVPARIVGADPNSDVALLRIDPGGLTLRPLPLGTDAHLAVGSPVAAIGSPFGEPQSLSVGVISALHRSIESLTDFQISDAIQTDAAINKGNSGGPLVDAHGRVIGINSQISSTSGGGEGVGYAVPIDTVKRSLSQLRRYGRASYAYIGVSTLVLYPQLARRLGLPVDRGAYVQGVNPGSPAAHAGLRGGSRTITFQADRFRAGGDVIARVEGRAIRDESDLARAVEAHRPGQTVTVQLYRGGRRMEVRVTLAERPANVRQRPG
ncbi:MAG TPA: trypsin-like peptidase domain-containing protein [Solirubrobacteraceae bacterium]|nr:trypsin-like peptidase domain-containing protein [Solirubrobacteraceae bacterium]